MRRIAILAAATIMLMATATPAAAATQHYRYTVHGSGAWASGVRYTDTTYDAGWVEIGDQATRASDGETFLSYVLFEHLREVCDATGCITKYTSGWVEGVPFAIDRKKLGSASVSVSIPAVRCIDDGQNQTCRDVIVPIRIRWTGTGSMIRSHGTANGGIAGEYQYTLNGAATERWANVTGRIGSFRLADASPIGAMYRTRQAERTLWHA